MSEHAGRTSEVVRWCHEWLVTLRHGTPLTRAGRQLRRNLRDGVDEYVEVGPPATTTDEAAT